MPRLAPPLVAVALALFAAACSARTATPSALRLDDATTPLGATPALGWNSFDVLSTSRAGYGQTWLNEGNVKNASDALAAKLGSAGYVYVNIDSGWSSNLA